MCSLIEFSVEEVNPMVLMALKRLVASKVTRLLVKTRLHLNQETTVLKVTVRLVQAMARLLVILLVFKSIYRMINPKQSRD